MDRVRADSPRVRRIMSTRQFQAEKSQKETPPFGSVGPEMLSPGGYQIERPKAYAREGYPEGFPRHHRGFRLLVALHQSIEPRLREVKRNHG